MLKRYQNMQTLIDEFEMSIRISNYNSAIKQIDLNE